MEGSGGSGEVKFPVKVPGIRFCQEPGIGNWGGLQQ